MTRAHDRDLQNATREMIDITNWNCLFAVTLTLKQAYYEGYVRVPLSTYEADKTLRHFRNLMNKAVLTKAAVRRGEKLNCISVYEEGNVRPHFHLCMDKPASLSDEHFIALIESCWRKTRFGYNQIDIKRCDAGWLDYMTKLRTKTNYDLSMDWLNFHNSNRAV